MWTFEKRISEAGAKALFDGVSAPLLKKSVLHPPSPLVSTGGPAITLSGIRFELAARSQPFKHYRQLTGKILSARCGHELQVTPSYPWTSGRCLKAVVRADSRHRKAWSKTRQVVLAWA